MRELDLFGIIVYTLFVFWVCGCVSVFIDIDHIYSLIGRRPPFKISESYGRPFHSRTIFALVACGISFIIAAFLDGLYRAILLRLGIGGTILLLISIIIISGVVFYKVGNDFGNRLREQRKTWRKEYLENQRGL
jgi:hypothetical protein